MTTQDKGQVTGSAAEIYDEFFVPALFQDWSDRVADHAQIQAGQSVLDVACGTGVLARAVHNRVGHTGQVVGIDINEGMLAVARSKSAEIEWKHNPAESLPFETGSFDAVVSQFGLMFFENRALAIDEIIRVLRPDGKLAIAVWDTLDNTPGYLYTDIKGWVLADMIDDQQFAMLLKQAQTDLASFVTDDGKVLFKAPAHIVSATKI